MNKKLDLFVTFFRIGAFTFGGGYAMVPLIKSEAADKKGWISEEDMLDIIAIAESTPGPIAINSATFVGYKTAGVLGSACATLGVVLPSFLIIALLGALLDRFSSLKPVAYAFFGIRAGVLALIIKALISMFKKCPKPTLKQLKTKEGSFIRYLYKALPYILMALAFCLVALAGVKSLWALLLAAAIGLSSYLAMEGGAKK